MATAAATSRTTTAQAVTAQRTASQPLPSAKPCPPAANSTTANAAGSSATAVALLRMRSSTRARARAACAPSSSPVPVPDTAGRHPLCPHGGVAHSPTVAPVTDIAMPVGQVPERLRRTLVGASAGVIRMAQPSLDGMALGKGADAPLSIGQRRVSGSAGAVRVRPRRLSPTGTGQASAALCDRYGQPPRPFPSRYGQASAALSGQVRVRPPRPSWRCPCGAGSRRAGCGQPPRRHAHGPPRGPWPSRSRRARGRPR